MIKQSLFNRIMLPAMIVLLLLPPLSCFVFQKAAENDAYDNAAQDLTSLQDKILPLLESSFKDSSEKYNSARPHTSRDFLKRTGQIVHSMNGNARIIIYGSDMQIIYPHNEEERAAADPIAGEFARYIQTSDFTNDTSAVTLKTSSGEKYLINAYKMPDEAVQIQYLVTYCSASSISEWVHQASRLVLVISSFFALAAFIVLYFTAGSIRHPLYQLCRHAKLIGNGNFTKLDTVFTIRELEELRCAMNHMSEQLQRSDQIQKDFFQNVSHELRNPLMSISGYAQGIQQKVFPSPSEAAYTILIESRRLTDLVNSLLTLSHIESLQKYPEAEQIPVMDSLENSLDRIQGFALQKNIIVTVLPFDPNLTILGNEELLEKILDNLLSNAVRYAKKYVRIKLIQNDKEVILSVLDDGNGIRENDLPYIFERCYKGKNGNFGLGLSIAQTAALTMKGKLTAANDSEGGAVFTLTIPQL